MNIVQLNTVNLGGDIVVKKSEGGSSSGGGSNVEYLDVSGLGDESYFAGLLQASVGVKAKISSGTMEGIEFVGMTMAMFAMVSTNIRDVKAVCIDFTSIVSQKRGDEVQSATVEYILVSNGTVSKEQLDAIPRITKEEFYHIDRSGAYIQHIDGTLYTANQWTNGGFSNDEANGIAVINETENFHLVVAKETLGALPWSSMSDTLIEGITTTTNSVEALADRVGVENTAIIAATDPNSAAAACANYTFPNGQKGYLMSPFEGTQIYYCEHLIEPLAQLLGMMWNNSIVWTDTQYDATAAWYVRLIGLQDAYYEPKTTEFVICPVCTLENYKFAIN